MRVPKEPATENYILTCIINAISYLEGPKLVALGQTKPVSKLVTKSVLNNACIQWRVYRARVDD